MPTAKVQLWCLVLLTSLSACSFTQQSQKTTHIPRKNKSLKNGQELVFLKNIKSQQHRKNSSHKIDAYQPEANTIQQSEYASKYQKKYAPLLEVNPIEVIPSPQLWSFIDEWWGIPYHYGGMTKSGIDCSAFSQKLYKKVYQLNALPRTARAQYKDAIKIKNIKDLEPGDLVFFKIHSRYISHVGIYLQNNKFISATVSSGITISDLTDAYWKRYYVGGGRPKNKEDHPIFLSMH